jgi:hypothetical protein
VRAATVADKAGIPAVVNVCEEFVVQAKSTKISPENKSHENLFNYPPFPIHKNF